MLRPGHPITDEVDVLFAFVLDRFVLKQILFQLLIFDLLVARFFGQLIGFVGLGREALAAGNGFQQLVEQIAHFALSSTQ